MIEHIRASSWAEEGSDDRASSRGGEISGATESEPGAAESEQAGRGPETFRRPIAGSGWGWSYPGGGIFLQAA